MGGRRLSARRLSMSPGAKRHLRKRKRKEQLGVHAKEPEVSRKGRWILALVVLVAFAIVMTLIEAMGGFARR